MKQKVMEKQISSLDGQLIRHSDHPVDPQFKQRWSPRSFDGSEIAKKDLMSMLEAARWAPSCFNEQPWLFYISNDQNFDKYLECLTEGNQVWAKSASRLGFLAARTSFNTTQRTNHTAQFDCGSAWMSFCLQGQALGLSTHAMAGYRPDLAYSTIELDPDNAEIVIAFAIGRAAEKELLPLDLRLCEAPSQRMSVEAILATDL